MANLPLPINVPFHDPKTSNGINQRWLDIFNNLNQSSSSFAPSDASYIVRTSESGLDNEQVLGSLSSGFLKVETISGVLTSTNSTVITATDLANTTVAAGSYTVNGAASYTVDQQGRLTSAASPVITITGTANKITVTNGATITPTITIATGYIGQTSITTLGTIGTGVWNGTSITTSFTDAKIKTVAGTANRLTVAGTSTDPTFDISTSYVGQATITTLGTITTGVWNGTPITPTYGGSPLTTKGDIFTYSTLGAKLGVGADGTVLSADSTQTTGLKWVAAGGTGTVTNVATGGLATGGPITTTGTVTVTAATQANMEAATSSTTAVTPSVVKYHPGVAKAFILAAGAGTSITQSYNVTSISDIGAGQLGVTFTTAFSTADYVTVSCIDGAANAHAQTTTSRVAGSITMQNRDSAGSVTDPPNYSIAFFGDQ